MRLNYIDCCDNVQGLKTLPDNSIDLTVTSPPYDNLRTYTGFSWDCDALITELYRVTKPGGVIVWIVNDATVKGSETGTSFRQALAFKEAGFNLHDTMIWKKSGAQYPETMRYYPSFEYMFVLSKGRPRAVNLIADRRNKHFGVVIGGTTRTKEGTLRKKPAVKNNTGRCVKEYGVRLNVWDVVELKNNRTGHPAPFPVPLAADHIISWSNPGDVVLDPFMGSGTTAIAALNTGRNYIGFEISEEYCEIARKRIEQRKEDDACADSTRQITRPRAGQQSEDEVMEEQTPSVV